MAKITRATQSIFGSSAVSGQIKQFGSLAAGAPLTTVNPETIQALSNYLGGWFSGVLGSNSPAIEDMNALCYLFAYQLAYILQAGVPEWDDGTTYYIGSFASDGIGGIYRSLTDTNINHALSNATHWARANGPIVTAINPATQSPYTMTSADAGKVFQVNSANGAMSFTLPAAVSGFNFSIIDVGGVAATSNITIVRAAAESIQGVAASYICKANYGAWQFVCDGTNYWLD